MKLSNNGFNLIKGFEGLCLTAARNAAGIWRIGYGSTRYHDGKAVKPGDKLAAELQADALLRNTINEYEDNVVRLVNVRLTQNQFDALVSFVYDEGACVFQNSILLAKLNEKNYYEAANCFLAGDKVTDSKTGKQTARDAILQRRRKERALFIAADVKN